MSLDAIRLTDQDNVATALQNLAVESVVNVTQEDGRMEQVRVIQDIPFGFKFAIKFIPKGGLIIKYGDPIGAATEDILKGALVHVHNVVGVRCRRNI